MCPFDLTQQPGEHPLAPAVRVGKQIIAHIDQNVQDYTATFVKRERIDGELGEWQFMLLKVRQQPFSVYLNFVKPHKGREVLFVEGQNDGNMLALECGWKRAMGTLKLPPDGIIAMSGQKHPITRIGIRNLTAEFVRESEEDMKFAESEVTSNPNATIDGRSATLLQIVHPVPRREFEFHMARVFVDNELRVPIHYDSFLWPERPGDEPPLAESYTYRNIKVNNGLTARDFDAENGVIFQ